MKRRIALAAAVATLLTLGLTACGNTFESMVKARDECHAAGGKFISWQIDQGGYGYECNLSDDGKEHGF